MIIVPKLLINFKVKWLQMIRLLYLVPGVCYHFINYVSNIRNVYIDRVSMCWLFWSFLFSYIFCVQLLSLFFAFYKSEQHAQKNNTFINFTFWQTINIILIICFLNVIIGHITSPYFIRDLIQK